MSAVFPSLMVLMVPRLPKGAAPDIQDVGGITQTHEYFQHFFFPPSSLSDRKMKSSLLEASNQEVKEK